MRESVVVAYGRSAVARAGKKGTLRNTHPIEYGAEVLRGVLDKVPGLPLEEIDDVIIGCVKPEMAQRQNMAKLITLRAQLPYSVPAQTVNRFCASGLQSIATAANMIAVGQADIVIAGGVESMTSIPYMGIGDPAFKDQWLDSHEPGAYVSMGITAENVAKRFRITRGEMESFAVSSHQKAEQARQKGFLAKDIIPVHAATDDGATSLFEQDECIRPDTSAARLAELKPCFLEDGLVTAGTSSPTSDGAAFVVLMSRQRAEELNITPIARFISFAVAGVDPSYMGIGPIAAIPKVMANSGLTIQDMSVIELNEAFAAQAIPCIHGLKLPEEKVNPNGGAIALGHPLGATGSILTCKALSQLRDIGGKYALVSMCIGGGMGAAGIFEVCDL